MIGATVYLTFHLQIVLGFSPLMAGLASLPLTIVISLVAPLATRFLSRVGARPLMIGGPLFAAAGLFFLSFITVGGNYLVQVLPALVLLGIGMAMLFVPMQNLALAGVAPHDAGAASATANAAMQIGGSLGLSIFTTAYAAAAGGVVVAGSASQLESFVSGYSAAFVAAGVAMLIGCVLAIVLIRTPKRDEVPEVTGAVSASD
ncbi:MFS transporter [Agromyces badenianii]|nr:MFS transporter [Agromyces badenianii]